MQKAFSKITVIIFLLLIFPAGLFAQEKKGMEMPPPSVVVSEIKSGMIAPESVFVGTVYFREVSDVASEVNGRVDTADFEEGQRVEKGDVLVRLNTDILAKSLLSAQALYEQALSDLEQARKDFARADSLRKEELISEQKFDENRYRVQALEKKAAALKADAERIETEFKKKLVKAPFAGVVVKKNVERGEWVAPGTAVATIAMDDVVDITVEVPEYVAKSVSPGMEVRITSGGGTISGRVVAVIPKGNTSTRTFPVKIRTQNSHALMEGMEARVNLPTGKRVRTLVISRDAVIPVSGADAVFAVVDGKARMIPVKVAGYEGLTAGVSAEGLKEGMKIVIKGNERLRDGQTVKIINEK